MAICNLRHSTGLALLLGLSFITANPASGEVVRFDFTGTVTNAFDNTPGDGDQIFDSNVTEGDAVTGSFTLDTSVVPFATIDGGFSGSGSGYSQSSVIGLTVALNGVTYSNDGAYNSGVVNDFRNAAAEPVFESFSVSDGEANGFDSTSGSDLLVDGVPRDAYLSLQFNDNDGTAFSSTALPTSLDLSQFEIAEGRIDATEPSGQFNPFVYAAFFSIDSITVTAVPEPGSVLLLSLLGTGPLLRRRSRQPN